MNGFKLWYSGSSSNRHGVEALVYKVLREHVVGLGK